MSAEPVRSWKLPAAIFGVCLLITALVLLVVLSPKREGGAGSADAVPAGPPTPVSATTLYEEYLANPVAAGKKYDRKLLKVTGLIIRVNRDSLELGAFGRGPTIVFCQMKRGHEGELAIARPGADASIVGVCAESSEESYVRLRDCRELKRPE
jgi:hypothetical protein